MANILLYIIGAGLVVVGCVLGFIILKIKKASTINNLSDTSYSTKIEEEIVLLKEAIKGVARNNGQENALYIKNLDKYDVSDEELNRVLRATLANKKTISGSKKDIKTAKKIAKGLI